MSRPSFQFYHGDWFSNAKLRFCTKDEKGHWIDTLCLLADADEFGILRRSLKEICEAIGGKLASLRALVEKGVLKGADVGQRCMAYVYRPRSGRKEGDSVTLIPEQDGPIWYSSKMVRDEYIRANVGKNTRFGHSPSHSPSRRKGEAPTPRQGASPSRRKGATPPRRESDGSPSPSPSPSPLKSLQQQPVDNSVDPELLRSFRTRLRDWRVKISNRDNRIAGWVRSGCTEPQLLEALSRAREYKGDAISMAYLAPVVDDVLAGRLNGGGRAGWWTSDTATKAKAAELGLHDRPGETMEDFRGRITEALLERKQSA